jgi:hypothetical protein
MKLHLTSKTYCLPLTWAEWDMLQCRENEYDDVTFKIKAPFFPESWKFPNKELIDDYEWNGHFGANIFFRVEVKPRIQAELDLVRFLQRYLKPTAEYIMGLHQGESGANMVMPSKLTRYKRAVFEAGYNTGQRVGVKKALEEERN